MESQVSTQLDYKKFQYVHPTYGFNKVVPLSGLQTANATDAGGQEVIFELPQNAMNLSKSFLSFSFNVPSVGAPTANGFNNIFKDCFPHFRQMQLYTRSGIYLCDLNELPNYTKVVWNAETKLKGFLQNDYMNGVAGAAGNANATPGNLGAGFHFHRSGVVRNSYTANAARPGIAGIFTSSPTVLFPTGANMTVAQTLNIPLNPNVDVTVANALTITAAAATPAASNVDYTEPSYVYRSANEAGTNESVLNMNVILPLSLIKNTIFSLDKDLYFGEIIVLRCVMQQRTKIAFINTTAAAAGSVVNLNTNAAGIAKDITYSNIALYLATEKNPEIVNQLRSQVASSGFSILIPYVWTYKNSFGTTTNQNASLRFNRGHGRTLQKIYHTLFNSTESSVTAYDHNNINGAKCTSYYTMLNNARLQEYNIDCTALDDYNLQRDCLKGKVLQTANMYQYNWYHLDNFDGKVDSESDSNLSTGLDFSMEQKWDIYCTTPATQYNHYTFAVTQKMLTVSSSGITVL